MLAQAHHPSPTLRARPTPLGDGGECRTDWVWNPQRSMERLQRLVDDDLRHMSPGANPRPDCRQSSCCSQLHGWSNADGWQTDSRTG